MIRTYIKLHQFAFLRESTTEPGDGTIIVAFDDHRWWWVYAARVDGIQYYPPAPEHRIVDPLSIAVGQRSRDYVGIIHAHKRIKLKQPPAKLLAALEQVKQRRQPRPIKRSRLPVFFWWIKRRSWLFWRGRRTWFHK